MKKIIIVLICVLTSWNVFAQKTFNDSIAAGIPEAQHKMSKKYLEQKDFKSFFEWEMKAAEQGLSEAQYNVGLSYYHGFGVETNSVQAAKWIGLSAEQGYVDAQFLLACYYAEGVGVKKDLEKSFMWFQKAAEQGSAESQRFLGDYYFEGIVVKKNISEGVKWYLKSAENGLAYSQRKISEWYNKGKNGCSQNDSIAFYWLKKAADQDDAFAVLDLSKFYLQGKETPIDYEKGFFYLQKGIELETKIDKEYGQILADFYNNNIIFWFKKNR